MSIKMAEGGLAGGEDSPLQVHAPERFLIWALHAHVGGEGGLIDYLGQLEDLIQGSQFSPNICLWPSRVILLQRVLQGIFSAEPGPYRLLI